MTDLATDTVDWAVELPDGDVWPIPVLPATADMPAVVLQDTDNGVAIAGIDTSGRPTWFEYVIAAPHRRHLHRAGGDVVPAVSNDDGSRLTGLDGVTGELAWQTDLPADSAVFPDSIDRERILTHDTSSITAVEPTTEVILWTHLPSVDTTDEFTLTIGSHNGTTVPLTAGLTGENTPEAVTAYTVDRNGETLWSKTPLPGLLGASHVSMGKTASATARITVIDSTLLIAAPIETDHAGNNGWSSYRHTIHAIDLASGTDLWTAPLNHALRFNRALPLNGDLIAGTAGGRSGGRQW